MPDPQDSVDIPGLENPARREAPVSTDRQRANLPGSKRWLGILFNCCHTYARIYRNDARGEYTGRCPTCGVELSVPIGPGGTNRRFFETTS